MSPNRNHALTILLWCLAGATVVPLWSARYLPFTDLPEHVAAMSTVAHLATRTGIDPSLYEIAFARSQYLVYHGLGALLSLVVRDPIIANQALLSLVAIAFPFSARAALRALGRDENLALFACMPFLCRPLFIGFLPYVASMPLYLYGVALVARQAQRGGTRVGLALYAFLLFFTHASATIIFIATAIVLEALFAARAATGTTRPEAAEGPPPLPRWLLARLRANVWLVPCVVALGIWWLAGRITIRSDSLSGPGEIGTMGFFRSLRALPLWSFDLVRTHVDEVCGIGWWIALVLIAALGALAPSDAPMPEDAAAPRTSRWIALLARVDPAFAPLLTLGVAYVVTPFRVGAGGMLNVRLAPLIALAAVLTVGRTKSKTRALAFGLVIVATLAHALNAASSIRTLAEEVAELGTILDAIPAGARVVSLQFDPRRRLAHVDPYPFVASYHRARGGGIASYSFSDLPHWPVQYKAGEAPPQKPAGLWIYHPCAYRNSIDGRFYDYVLVGGSLPPFANEPEGPVFREVRRVRGFSLYEKVPGQEWHGPDAGPCAPTPVTREPLPYGDRP